MSIFNPAPVDPAAAAAQQVKLLGNQAYDMLVRSFIQAYNIVWNNKTATAQQVVAAMGTEANKVFGVSAATGAFLASLGATVPTTVPAGWSYTANPDGSITLTKSA